MINVIESIMLKENSIIPSVDNELIPEHCSTGLLLLFEEK